MRNNSEIKSENIKIPAVAFVIFNRPNYAQQVFNEIRKAKPRKLFVIADGPRTPSEIAICEETRKIIDQVDWDCEVHKNYAERNMGLKKRFHTGLNWFFENVEEGIILEDDCLPHQSFFRFTGEMLEKYRNNEGVMMIQGSNSLNELIINESYTFSRYFAIWGWATWKRAWSKYDAQINDWPKVKETNYLKNNYGHTYMIRHLTDLFNQVYLGKTNTWDIQWFYTCMINGGLSVVPKVNMISNIGVDGTHTMGNNQNLKTNDIFDSKITHPKIIECDHKYDNLFYKKNFYQTNYSFYKRIMRSAVIDFLVGIRILRIIYRHLAKIKVLIKGYGFFENVNNTNYSKNCLMSYIVEPFKIGKNNYRHQNFWQAKEISKIIGEFGYNVDVINYNEKRVKLTKNYDLVIDLHPNPSNLYSNNLKPFAKKISYITGSNPVFSDFAEKSRINDIHKRTGVKLKQRRFVEFFDKTYFKTFDSMFLIGNNKTLSTYKEILPEKVFLIPNTGYSFLENSDMENKSPKNFLFHSGAGQVHKGLDLLLESFSKNPDLHLYICSNFSSEKDFSKLYSKQLYDTPNIHPVGFVDIDSFEFIELAKKCTYIISPSCSEGISGAVLSGMSAGLIPLVSEQSGLDEEDAILLRDCTIEGISKEIANFSHKSKDWIESESKKALSTVKNKYSRGNFSDSIRNAINQTINDANNPKKPLISVIMPAHNSSNTIELAINSIINQTYKNIEVIIVDDNSTDETKIVVEKISKTDPRVKYFKLPFDDPNRINKRGRNINAGYMARNYGVEKTKGEWITFQDADDASLLNRIEVQFNLAKEYNSSHVCIQSTQFKKEYVGKKLDVNKILKERTNTLIPTSKILSMAKKSKGPIIPIIGKLNEYIPFEFKRLRVINKLFFGSLSPYPAAGNCPLVKKEVFTKIKFNPLNKRIFPSFMGRGADRDFNFRVAEEFKDSLGFYLPLYLWNPIGKTDELTEYEKYIYE